MTSEGLAIHSWKKKRNLFKFWILQDWQWFMGNCWCAWAAGYDVSINFDMLEIDGHVFLFEFSWCCASSMLNWLQRTYPKNGWDGPCFCRSPNVRVKPPHAQWLRQQKLKGQSPLLRESMQSRRAPWPRTRSCPILCRQLLHHLLPGLLLTGPVCWLWLWSASTCNKCCLDSIFFFGCRGWHVHF